MSGTTLATVMLIAFAVMMTMSYWRQIAIFMLYLVITTFCIGMYYIVSTIVYLF
jgi:hypothetical protein